MNARFFKTHYPESDSIGCANLQEQRRGTDCPSPRHQDQLAIRSDKISG